MRTGEITKLKANPDSTYLSEAIKEYLIPFRRNKEGVSVPVQPVVLVDPVGTQAKLITPSAPASTIWTARFVVTQTAVGAGALRTDLTPGEGNYFELIECYIINSGTNGISIYDSDSAANKISDIGSVGSAAGTKCSLPSIGTAASSTGNIKNSVGMRVFGSDRFSIDQTGAGAQNDTLTINIRGFVKTIPTISIARSAGTPTIAATYNALVTW